MCLSIWKLILYTNIFIMVANVPTGLQTCAKVLQIQTSGGGGKPWMQSKSNVTFKLATPDVLKYLEVDIVY